MIEIRSRLSIHSNAVSVAGRLQLTFERRSKSRQLARLVSGESVAIVLPPGEVLRGGDRVVTSDGRVIEVVAQSESVLHVVCATPRELVRCAYHLGNRHVAVQVGDGWLRIAADHVLEAMLKGLGAIVSPIEAPFEPETGAYASHSHHGAAKHDHAARIHEYGATDGRPPEDRA